MGRRFRFELPIVLLLVSVIYTTPVFAQTKITIGVAAMSPRTIPLLIAREQGLFAKQGIEARVVLIKGAPTLVASLISGDIDVGYTGGTAVLGAASQGLYLRILSSVSNKLTHTLIANPSFKTAEQLRGKRFGIQSIGGSTWMHTILGLEHIGLDVKRDNINLLVIGDSVLIGQSLEAGRIDAAVLDGALVRRLKSKGFYVLAELGPANIPMLNQAIVVSQDFLQKRAEVAEKILMALVDSLAYTLAPQNKSVVARTIMARFHISDTTVADEGYQDLLTSVERKPIPSLDALRNIKRLMAVQSPKAADVKVEELIDARLVRKLDESGYMDKVAASYGFK
jgi:ABC-type nitrate/sulfonate/bicarbonate transport system substrate-binding protein